MMMKLNKITLIKILAGSTIFLAASQSFATDYSKAEKELNIMSKIFETSLAEATQNSVNNRRSFPFSDEKPDATYLAKQGMVFKFNFGNNQFGPGNDWQAFGEGIGQLVGSISAEIARSFSEIDLESGAPIAPPAPPMPSRDWEQNIEAYEDYHEAMSYMRDAQREQREQVRDLQRSIRDIERNARNGKNDNKKLEETKAKLEKKMKELAAQAEEYEKSMEEYRNKKQQEINKRNAARTSLIATTLCDYGATLRSLKNDEYITLVFEGFENGKSQIHVFKYDKVKNCQNKDKLMNSAISYLL